MTKCFMTWFNSISPVFMVLLVACRGCPNQRGLPIQPKLFQYLLYVYALAYMYARLMLQLELPQGPQLVTN